MPSPTIARLHARGEDHHRAADDLYDIVKQWASVDGTSINSWMHEAIEREAFRRRCIAHGQWMDANPAIRDELLA